MAPQMSKLHEAASQGSVERTIDLLSKKKVDVDLRYDQHGWTPLMVASEKGYLRVIRALLKYGADVTAETDHGFTALHLAASYKRLAVTKTLIKAGARLETRAECTFAVPRKIRGQTPLHMAAGEGFFEGIVALIGAGADVDSRLDNGATPLYLSACRGHIKAVKFFLQVKADPLLPVATTRPVDVAAQEGHAQVVYELIQRFGIDGCAGEGGIAALESAAYMNHTDIVAFLCESGAVDEEATALCAAVDNGSEASMKLLVEKRGGNERMEARDYVNISKGVDSPLLCTLDLGRGRAPRIARFLIDQGMDTASEVRYAFDDWQGGRRGSDTHVEVAKLTLAKAENDGVSADTMDGLRGVIRLLQQVDAAHANSWSWPNGKKSKNNNKERGKINATPTLSFMAAVARLEKCWEDRVDQTDPRRKKRFV